MRKYFGDLWMLKDCDDTTMIEVHHLEIFSDKPTWVYVALVKTEDEATAFIKSRANKENCLCKKI